MGGIVGSWRIDGGPVEPAELSPMLSAIRHRGPDDAGDWHHRHAALAHCRLSMLDPTPASHQPMVTADGMGALAYDGEVYNYRELRRDLEDAGIAFRSAGDTEVVLHALHHWGPAEAIPRFNGMFALAYVDLRQSALWLSRDRMGIKPLTTTSIGPTLLFASEAKALIAHPLMRPKVDRAALLSIIIEERYCGQLSIFDGVEVVEAGSYWKVDGAGLERRQYFDVLRTIDVEKLVRAERSDPATFVKAFQVKLENSVRQHLVAHAPVAATCSGGIDSGLISASAREANPDLVAYVVDAPVGRGEGALGERVGRHLGIEVRRVPVDQERFLRLWPRTVWHGASADRPSNYANAPASLALSEACRADGFKGLLMGQGADALFGEQRAFYVNYRKWQRLSWIERLMPLKAYRRKLRELTAMPLVDMAGERNPTLHAKFAMTLNGDSAFLGRRLFDRLSGVKRPGDRAYLADCLLHFCNTTPWLLQRHERMGMAASLEVRMPFLDNDLVDFAINLPRRAKLHRGQGKWVAKAAARSVLPREALATGKTGFAIPPDYYAGTERLLLSGMLAEHLAWSPATTEAVVSELAREDNFKFFAVGLELWLRLYFGNEDAEALGERLVALATTSASR